MSYIQTFKSAYDLRARPDNSFRLASERLNAGHGILCPAGAQNINFDVYGRPVTQNTLDLRDSSCSNYIFDVRTFMGYESNARPSVPISQAGLRGGDTLNVGREIMPRDLYGYNPRGYFHKDYNSLNNTPPTDANKCSSCERLDTRPGYSTRIQPFDNSNDGTGRRYK